MSERYNYCRKCSGRGKYMYFATPNEPGALPHVGPTGQIIYYVEIECPRCGGTGHSGDAMERGSG